MRRLSALTFAAFLATAAVWAQTPERRAFLLAVDDLHLDFRSTPRVRTILQDIVKRAREDDVWALVTTGLSSVRVNPGPASAVLEAVGHVAGNEVAARESLNAFGDADRATIIRRRASGADAMIGLAISYFARTTRGPLNIVYLTDGYDARMVPALSEVVRNTAETRSRFVVVAVRDVIPAPDPPGDVKPDEWAAYLDARRTSIRALAEQTGGTAVFSRDELDAALTRLSQP
jgi:hypothetical protein